MTQHDAILLFFLLKIKKKDLQKANVALQKVNTLWKINIALQEVHGTLQKKKKKRLFLQNVNTTLRKVNTALQKKKKNAIF